MPSSKGKSKLNSVSNTSWADTMEGNNCAQNAEAEDNNVQDNVKYTVNQNVTRIPMFTITNSETPYLIGVKGRNISLIRKFTGILISIENYSIFMTPIRKNSNLGLAWRMVLSASFGGILRWFETPYATKKGFPQERIDEFQKLAMSMDFSIDLLRSRRGHMCLILIPQLSTPVDMNRDSLDIFVNNWKDKIAVARKAFLETLNT